MKKMISLCDPHTLCTGFESVAALQTVPLPWFAIRVRSNHELVVSTLFRCKGYEEFLPRYKSCRRWSDRAKEIELPLFPGYVFCRFDPERRRPIVTTPGVVSVLGIGRIPVPVRESEIEVVQAILRSGLPALPSPFLKVGQAVCVERGPLAGVEGNVEHFKNKYRLVVSVTLLQRSVAVEIDRDWVRPVSMWRRPGA